MIRCMGCMQSYPEQAGACPHCGYQRGTPAREAYHLAPESILQGRYIVGRVLGYGGFGVTYIGYDAQLDRVVAIKEFLPTTFATRMPGGTAVTVYAGTATQQFDFGLDRFVQEAQRLAQFNGIPGITDIYDTFSGNNTAYIVMEYLKGRDVKDLLSAGGPLPYEQARDIVLRVCDTLAPVHARGIIHRDISPDNIYLTDAGEVKLLDFGAARYESSVNSKSLSVILKAGYAPEEQYRSKGDQGPWTDVYALAATFYKMLTGATPPDSMERAIQDDLQEPSKLGVPMPQSAENALLNALNIRKADRTQSVADFKAALLADGVERVKAKPAAAAGTGFPLWGKISLAAAGVLLVVLAVLGGTGSLGGDIGGRVLEDSFGNPIAEGNVGVPALSGKTQAEAQKLLEDAGLVMELGPAQYSDTGQKGVVLTQEPLSGRQIEEGGAVTVILNGGSIEQAMADGDIPDLVGMDAAASVGFIQHTLGEDYSAEYRYGYSDTTPIGSITRFEREPGNTYMYIYISAGPDNASPPHGELRAPLLYGFHRNLAYTYAIASVTPRDNNDDVSYNVALTLSAAKEGGSWQTIYETHTDYWMSDEELARGTPYHSYHHFVERLLASHADLVGAPLQLRLEREATRSEGGAEIVHDSVQFSQTFEIQLAENDLVIDSAEDIGWDGVQELLDDGTIPADHYLREDIEGRYFDEMDSEQREYIRPILFKGNFSSNSTYNTILIEGQDYSEDGYTFSDGMMLYFDQRMSHSGERQLKLKIYPDSDIERVQFSEDGSHALLVVPTPVEYTLTNSTITPEEAAALGDAEMDEMRAEEMARAAAEGAPIVSVDSTQAEADGPFHSMNLSVAYGNYSLLYGILFYSVDGGDWVAADEWEMSPEKQAAAGEDPSFYPYAFSPSNLGISEDMKVLQIRVELIDPDSGDSVGVYDFDVPSEW